MSKTGERPYPQTGKWESKKLRASQGRKNHSAVTPAPEEGMEKADYMDCPQVLLDDLELSYAMTIHKSMGSEYDTVIIPLLAAHNVLLTRNLLYTAITRAKRRVLLVGEKRALYMAIHRSRKGKRNTMLGERIALYYKAVTRKALRNEEGEEWQRAS